MRNKIKNARQSKLIFICLAFFLLFTIVYFAAYIVNASKEKHNLVVAIDPGHGGFDPGKVTSDGIAEKDVNLSISLCLKEMLENKGVEVVITREKDEGLYTLGASNKKMSDMKKRVEIINDANPDCLISIHQNSFSSPSACGSQVFYYSESKKSEELAIKIQELLKREVDKNNKRTVKKGNDYYVLRKTKCASVIVECGFLSNKLELSKLTDMEYQRKIATAITEAICEYYGIK